MNFLDYHKCNFKIKKYSVKEDTKKRTWISKLNCQMVFCSFIRIKLFRFTHLKLIICYISSCSTKPSKYCWGQQLVPQSWLVNYIGHCSLLSNHVKQVFFVYLFLAQLDSAHMRAQMVTSAQFKFALYIISFN